MTLHRGIHLTICLAIKCKRIGNKKEIPSILFAADTQESSAILKRSATKLRIAPGKEPKKGKGWKISIASSGDTMVVDEVYNKIQYFLWKKLKPEQKNPSTALMVYREEIADLAYDTHKKYKDRDVENPYFELILGAADEFSTILHITHEGKNQVLDRFGVIGSGRVTGGELLLGEFLKEEINEDEAAILAALVISTVGHVDMFVGGEPDMCICRERTVWEFTEDAYQKLLKNSKDRWDLMKKTWVKMQKDSTLKSKLKNLLES